MYSYKPRHSIKLRHAYTQNRNLSKQKNTGLPKKYYFLGAAIIIIFGALGYWLFLSANFRLEKVQVDFARNFSSQDLETMAWDQAKTNQVLPADNLWLFDKKKLVNTIEEKYYLDNLKIKIRLPHTLVIKFKERDYGLAWQEDNKFYYINYQGDIIMQKDDVAKNVAVVYNRGRARKEGRQIKIEEKYLSFADNLNRAFNEKIKGLTERQIFIDDELNTIKIQITNGPIIKFNTEESVDKQLVKLETLRRIELSDGKTFNSKSYIDLRYGDRIFYQ